MDRCQTPRAQRPAAFRPSSPLMPRSHMVSTTSVPSPRLPGNLPGRHSLRVSPLDTAPSAPGALRASGWPLLPLRREGTRTSDSLPLRSRLPPPWWCLESAAPLAENVGWWLQGQFPAPDSPSWPGSAHTQVPGPSDLSQTRVSSQKSSAAASTGSKLALAFVFFFVLFFSLIMFYKIIHAHGTKLERYTKTYGEISPP